MVAESVEFATLSVTARKNNTMAAPDRRPYMGVTMLTAVLHAKGRAIWFRDDTLPVNLFGPCN